VRRYCVGVVRTFARQRRRLQEPLRRDHALPYQPARRRGAELRVEAPAEGPLAHPRATRQPAHRDRLPEVLQRPVQHWRDRRTALGGRNGFRDELRLAPFPMGRDHQAPRDLVGDGSAVILAHHMHAQVEAGSAARGGQDLPLVDVQHVGHQLHPREALGERPRVAPVCRGTLAVEQTGRREHEGARADGNQTRPAGVRPPQRGKDGRRDRLFEVVPPARHDHRARALERAEAMGDAERHAALGA